MLGEAQDVLLAAETSLARHHNRRRGDMRPTEEAPHCLTCCCLDNRQVACSQRCTSSSSRRHSDRRNTTVDELLRQMSYHDAPTLYDDREAYANSKNEVEDGCESSSSAAAATAAATALPLACPSRCAVRARGGGGGSYCEVGKSPETTARSSCERWLPPAGVEPLDNASHIRSTKSGNAEGSERHSDGSKGKWRPTSDRKNSRRLQQLFGAGDRNAQSEEPAVKAAGTTRPDEAEEVSSSAETLTEEAHVRELKLVRWQFIERIHDEVSKLHRLQRHLDGCRSPPTPRLARRRSVSTMTSARLLLSEPNVSGQF